MKSITVTTPGKVILLGEHAVVYGKPALLATINKYCNIKLTPVATKDITINAKNLHKSITVSPEIIFAKTKSAREKWQQYYVTNELSILKSITADAMDYPIIAIGETLLYFKKKLPTGFVLTIDSGIPMGSGLGSSSALAVGVVTAVARLLAVTIDKQILNDIAFLIEQKKHGTPSGADTAAVSFGGLLWFRKETSDLKFIQPLPFALPERIAQNFVLIDSGQPVESTGEMVSNVRNLYKEKPELFENFLQQQENITRELLTAIKNRQEEVLMQLIQKGEGNLEKIEVVSPSTKLLIHSIEKAGGVAKICGAGGKKKGSGIVLAYHPEKKQLETIANSKKLVNYTVQLGL